MSRRKALALRFLPFAFAFGIIVALAWSRPAAAQIVTSELPAARISCGANLDTSYVLGVNAKVDNGPVIQGWCRSTAPSGAYAELWGSQSLKDPGLDKRLGNEWDLTFGVDRKLGESWSYDVRVAHFDLANPRLFDFGGDVAMLAGTLRHHLSSATTLYLNVEAVEGYGPARFQGGQRVDLGVGSNVGPVAYTAEIRRNNHIGGNDGQLVKLVVSPAKPIAKIGGGVVTPSIMLYKPLGRYGDVFETQVVGRLAITW